MFVLMIHNFLFELDSKLMESGKSLGDYYHVLHPLILQNITQLVYQDTM